jgi:hypothetical protein
MSHRFFRPLILSLLVVLLVVSSSAILFAADTPDGGLTGEAGSTRAIAGATDVVAHGTAWVPQLRNRFSRWWPLGWGTEVRSKAAFVGQDQWVHISIPFTARISDTALRVERVEFCAKSSNGAQTRPVRLDVWSEYYGQLYSAPVNWAPNNNVQCPVAVFSPPVSAESLGVSVWLHFANSTDVITLQKAWARVMP